MGRFACSHLVRDWGSLNGGSSAVMQMPSTSTWVHLYFASVGLDGGQMQMETKAACYAKNNKILGL